MTRIPIHSYLIFHAEYTCCKTRWFWDQGRRSVRVGDFLALTGRVVDF